MCTVAILEVTTVNLMSRSKFLLPNLNTSNFKTTFQNVFRFLEKVIYVRNVYNHINLENYNTHKSLYGIFEETAKC